MKKVFSLLLVLIMSLMISSVCAYAAPDNPFFIDEDAFNKLVEEGRIPGNITYDCFLLFMKNCDSNGNFYITEDEFNMLVERGIVPRGVTYDYFLYFMNDSDNLAKYLFGDNSEVD
jgi:hypothetical protein